MFGRKPEPKPDTTFKLPLNLMNFEELVELSKKIQELTAARLPEALLEAEQRHKTLRTLAGIKDAPQKQREKPKRAVNLYRNPSTGEEYTKGKHPPWLQEALAAGKSKNDFLVHREGA